MGDTLKAGVVGLGNGAYLGRAFDSIEGVELTKALVLGKNLEKSKGRIDEVLQREWEGQIVTDIKEMDDLDMVAVSSPTWRHGEHLEYFLENGVHCLGDKPLVSHTDRFYDTHLAHVGELYRLARSNELVLAAHHQNVMLFRDSGDMLPQGPITDLDVTMMTWGKERSLGLLVDLLTHPNSMLLELVPEGNIKNAKVTDNYDNLQVKFTYASRQAGEDVDVNVMYYLGVAEDKAFGFTVNDTPLVRTTVREPTFQVQVATDYAFDHPDQGKFHALAEDPTDTSVKAFVSAVRGEGRPMVGEYAARKNYLMMHKIMKNAPGHS